MSDSVEQPPLPQAVLRPERRPSWIWLLPIAVAVLAVWIGYRSWMMRGVEITVQLEEGYGLEPGADVRYSGISVGQVREVRLAQDLSGVVVSATLFAHASDLARAGARFWIVRPQFDVTGIAGLETVVGPRYLAMLPGDGPPRRRFLGLNHPPIVEAIEPGDLEIILYASNRGSLRPGAPVLYRQVHVGTVLSVGLTSDGGGVEARVYIQKAYAELVRPQTRFWDAGGLEAQVGIRGVSIQVDSVASLLAGGVALATPPQAGPVVGNGHRFAIATQPEKEWLEWEPLAVIGSHLLPPGSVLPTPLRAVIGWKKGRWFKSEQSRRGWVLQTRTGLLGPADLLQAGDKAEPESAVLEIAGRQLPLTTEPTWRQQGLCLVEAQVGKTHWPESLQRHAEQPEDCLAVADRAAAPLPLAAARLATNGHAWLIDPSVSIDSSWHGACVLARRDGKLVGMILVSDGQAQVALLPQL